MSQEAARGESRPHVALNRAIQQAVRSMGALNGVEGALIASRDGLLVAGDAAIVDSLELKAAMSAAIFGAIDRASTNINIGRVRAALVETPTHSLQLLNVAELLFVVVAGKKANMATIRAGMARAAATISNQALPAGGGPHTTS